MEVEENPLNAGRDSVAENPLLHSIDGACRRLSIGRSWLYAEIAAGNIKVAKLGRRRSEEHTSELQSLMRSSYAVFCLKKKKNKKIKTKSNIKQSTVRIND